MNGLDLLATLGALLALGIAIPMSARERRQRIDALTREYAALGLQRIAPAMFYDSFRITEYNLLRGGLTEGCEYAFTGAWGGKQVTVFSQRIARPGVVTEEERLRIRIVFVSVPESRLPRFVARPERSLYHRVQDLLGRSDTDFSDDAAFSDFYHLAGPDDARVRRVFTRRVRQVFMKHLGVSVESGPDGLVVFVEHVFPLAGKLMLQAADAAAQLTIATEIATTLCGDSDELCATHVVQGFAVQNSPNSRRDE